MSSRQMALCGLLTALAVTVLMLGGVLQIATFCGPLLAMIVLLPILEEYGSKAALLAYAAASILSLLLAADREMCLIYLGFGWYPVLRPWVAKLPSKALRIFVRLVICNGVILLTYGLILRLMGLTADLLEASRWFNALLLVLGNAIFLLSDQALGRMSLLWRIRFRTRFRF